jgi:hypothetical protein
MAVVIHEFEVEAQEASKPSGAASSSEAGAAPQPAAVAEIERLLRCYQERCERLRAH